MKCPHCGRDSRAPVAHTYGAEFLRDFHQHILQYNTRHKQGMPTHMIFSWLRFNAPAHMHQDLTQMLEVRDGAYWARDHDKGAHQ